MYIEVHDFNIIGYLWFDEVGTAWPGNKIFLFSHSRAYAHCIKAKWEQKDEQHRKKTNNIADCYMNRESIFVNVHSLSFKTKTPLTKPNFFQISNS